MGMEFPNINYKLLWYWLSIARITVVKFGLYVLFKSFCEVIEMIEESQISINGTVKKPYDGEHLRNIYLSTYVH